MVILEPQKEIDGYTIYQRRGPSVTIERLPKYVVYRDGMQVRESRRYESAKLWVRNQNPATARKSWKTVNRIDGDSCFQAAQQKARFGHRDWIYWSDQDGKHAEVKSVESVKRALMAAGTKGFWVLIHADSGIASKGFFAMGLNLLRQIRHGGG
jgi:hypothetical protein